jgi:hypothetical protein
LQLVQSYNYPAMKSSLYDRVFERELGNRPHNASLKGLYGASEWIDELDIVNELGGHTGCVNALRYVSQYLPASIFLADILTDTAGRILGGC